MPDSYQPSVGSSTPSDGVKSAILPEVLLLRRHGKRSRRRFQAERNRVPVGNRQPARHGTSSEEIRL